MWMCYVCRRRDEKGVRQRIWVEDPNHCMLLWCRWSEKWNGGGSQTRIHGWGTGREKVTDRAVRVPTPAKINL